MVCKCCGRDLPESEFAQVGKNRTSMCKECVKRRRSEGQKEYKRSFIKNAEHEIMNARNLRLCDFTPRELMGELKRRGYTFTMEYTETHIINSKDIEI